MKLIIDNIRTQAVVGGKDNLLKVKVMKELREYMRVRPDGYRYSAAYKDRKWDGWRYFITERGMFATGFVPMVLKLMAELGVPVEIQDERGDMPYLQSSLCTQVGGLTLAEHQVKSIESVNKWVKVGESSLYFPRGILDGATNAGKTAIIAGVHNNIAGEARGVFITHSTLIYRQAVEYFGGLYGHVGQVNPDRFDLDSHFTVAMAKTLLYRSEKLNVKKELLKYNVLYMDETHKAGSSEFSELLERIPAPMRLFVSGTPLDNDSKTSNMIVVGLSGPVLMKITNKELIDKKWSLKPIIKMVLNHSPRVGKVISRSYQDELEEVVQFSHHKNRLIADLIKARNGKQVLVSFEKVKHGEFIYEYLKSHPEIKGVIELAHGTDKERFDKIERFKRGEVNVLLSSMIIKEGVNIPNIQCLILAMGGKSIITVKQLIGRAIRKNKDEETVEVIDFYDVGEHVGKHSRDRLRIYKKEEFDVECNFDKKEALALCK